MKTVQFLIMRFHETSLLILSLLIILDYFLTDWFYNIFFQKVRKIKYWFWWKPLIAYFSDIQNLFNAVSDWLIQKINNPIETNETISCACCHIVCDNSGTSWAHYWTRVGKQLINGGPLGGSHLEKSFSSTTVFAVFWYREWFVAEQKLCTSAVKQHHLISWDEPSVFRCT